MAAMTILWSIECVFVDVIKVPAGEGGHFRPAHCTMLMAALKALLGFCTYAATPAVVAPVVAPLLKETVKVLVEKLAWLCAEPHVGFVLTASEDDVVVLASCKQQHHVAAAALVRVEEVEAALELRKQLQKQLVTCVARGVYAMHALPGPNINFQEVFKGKVLECWVACDFVLHCVQTDCLGACVHPELLEVIIKLTEAAKKV